LFKDKRNGNNQHLFGSPVDLKVYGSSYQIGNQVSQNRKVLSKKLETALSPARIGPSPER